MKNKVNKNYNLIVKRLLMEKPEKAFMFILELMFAVFALIKIANNHFKLFIAI